MPKVHHECFNNPPEETALKVSTILGKTQQGVKQKMAKL